MFWVTKNFRKSPLIAVKDLIEIIKILVNVFLVRNQMLNFLVQPKTCPWHSSIYIFIKNIGSLEESHPRVIRVSKIRS